MKYGLFKIVVMMSGMLALFPTTINANSIVLDGHWDNFNLGTGGEWYLSYQRNSEQTLLSLDFDGDFLGVGVDPDALNFSGETNDEGSTTLSIEGHSSFGDVLANINQQGAFEFRANDMPVSIVQSIVLKGAITSDSFDFLYDLYFEEEPLLFTPNPTYTSGLISYIEQNPGSTHTSGSLELTAWVGPLPTIVPLPNALLLFLSGLGLVFKYRKGRYLNLTVS